MRILADTRHQQSDSSCAPFSVNDGVSCATERARLARQQRPAPIVALAGVMAIPVFLLLGGVARPLPGQAHMTRSHAVEMIVATSAPTPMTPCPGGGTPCP